MSAAEVVAHTKDGRIVVERGDGMWVPKSQWREAEITTTGSVVGWTGPHKTKKDAMAAAQKRAEMVG